MSTPPVASPSHIRVFVAFKEDAVFAGDQVEATITFKNVNNQVRPQNAANSNTRTAPAPSSRRPSTTSFVPSRATHSRQPSLASQTTKAPELSPRSPHGHRQAQSLNILDNAKADRKPTAHTSAAKSASHSRSVSILSFGSDTDKPKKGRPASIHRNPARPGFKLTRSASMQITAAPTASPRSLWTGPAPASRPFPSPLSTAISPPPDNAGMKSSPKIITPDSAIFPNGNSSQQRQTLPLGRKPSGKASQPSPFPPSSFKFPASPDPGSDTGDNGFGRSTPSSANPTPVRPAFNQSHTEPMAMLDPRANDRRSHYVGRVLSLSSEAGTPRSSIDQTDVYSSSNHSDDTATSEGSKGTIGRLFARPSFFRQPSQLGVTPRQRPPETLMMGFAQLYGSFTVDGSLINQGPFEEVKRRAVVGGQGGGGVVGIERPKTDSRLFGSFSWGNIGESLGGILGGNEPSSMREMKGKAQSKSIPLLSTPKSILFVDLKLAPGESKSYTYRIPLPRGLPPSHRGRAMKIAYQLVVGTQRAGTGKLAKEQQIRHVEVPFRLFGGVDGRGEVFSHDLMSPYIVLRDEARTNPVEEFGPKSLGEKQKALKKPVNSTEADFNDYIQSLLSNPHRGSTASILSPMSEPATPSASYGPSIGQSSQSLALDTRSLIDNAIRTTMQSSAYGDDASSQPATSRTNFTIARGGQPIANLLLSKPALRLGDLIHITLDFGAASAALAMQRTPTLVHALTLTLESSESVDPALAIRSATSVERVTRRVWDRRIVGGANGAALGWCSKWSGSMKIPAGATPGFVTSGVGCSWCIRVEIGVGVKGRAVGGPEGPSDDSDEDDSIREDDRETDDASHEDVGLTEKSAIPTPQHKTPSNGKTRSGMLLEHVAEDERGTTAAAVRQIASETFEIAVPIRVFGAAGAVDMAAREAQDMDGMSI